MIKIDELDIHITNECNLSCIHCCFDAGRLKISEMSVEQWKKILRDGRDLGIKTLDITGGEPLLYEGVTSLIEYAYFLNYEINLQTNGLLFDSEKRKILKLAGLNSVMISVDGWESGYAKVRRSKHFQKVLRNIAEAVKESWMVRINIVAMKCNISTILRLIDWAEEKGVQVISIFYFTPQGRGSEISEEVLSYQDWIKLVQELTIIAQKIKKTKIIVEPAVGPLNGRIDPMQCPIKKRGYLQILCNGLAYPCTMLINSDLYIADLQKESLIDGLNEERWERLTPSLHCSTHKNNSCFGGCIGYETWNTGKLGADPRCEKMESGTFPVCPLMKLDLSKGIKAFRSSTLTK